MLEQARKGGNGRIKSWKTRFYYACLKGGKGKLTDKNDEKAILLCFSAAQRLKEATKEANGREKALRAAREI